VLRVSSAPLPLLGALTLLTSSAVAGAQDVDGSFDVGGRAIHLMCRGTGYPTVVVDAGMGTAPAEDERWQGIAGRIATSTRICLHDRAGLGGSDPAPEAVRTSADAAADLHAALHKADIAGPYLLVGHSIGGLHAQVFAIPPKPPALSWSHPPIPTR